MSDVIDLTAERNKREAPDEQFVRRDEYGRSIYCFSVEYDFAGAEYVTQVWAYDMADADARVAAIRNSARVAGQLYSEIPA